MFRVDVWSSSSATSPGEHVARFHCGNLYRAYSELLDGYQLNARKLSPGEKPDGDFDARLNAA